MEEVHKKNKLTQWGSHILTSILMSHMMVTKNPQNVHRKYFWAILLTFIFDVKIDINICEPHYVNLLFFVNLLHSLHVWLFFWQLDIILTHQLNLNHLSPHRAIFYLQFSSVSEMITWHTHVTCVWLVVLAPKDGIAEMKILVLFLYYTTWNISIK